MWITVLSVAHFSIHMVLKPCKDPWYVNKWMNGALYMYINVCTYMHLHWMLLHPLCSWSGYVPGQSVLGLSLSRGPYPVFSLCGMCWLVGQRVWVRTHQGWSNEWASQAGAQGTNLQGALRYHCNNWKYVASDLRFPHLKEFIWKLSAVWACAHRQFHNLCPRMKKFKGC